MSTYKTITVNSNLDGDIRASAKFTQNVVVDGELHSYKEITPQSSVEESNIDAKAELNGDLRFGAEFVTPSAPSGTNDYEKLINKPKINTVVLIGDKSFEELGLNRLTNTEIENLLK